jgi:hypothetical protein
MHVARERRRSVNHPIGVARRLSRARRTGEVSGSTRRIARTASLQQRDVP